MVIVSLFESLHQQRQAEEERPTASSTHAISGIAFPALAAAIGSGTVFRLPSDTTGLTHVSRVRDLHPALGQRNSQ
jgi:hypothetical protein